MWGNNVINVIQAGGKTYLTVDLTLFELPQNTSHENTLLIRDQYVLAYDIILADTRKGKKRKSAFLVTGQTGIGVLGYPFLQRIFANLTLSIGKTLFLLYILARRLHERQPVALQVDASNFALFDKGGASLHESSPISAYLIPEGAWALSDSSGGEVVEPCSAFKWHRTHIVHTSSPASCHWTKDVFAIRHVMDIWSLEELQTLLYVLS